MQLFRVFASRRRLLHSVILCLSAYLCVSVSAYIRASLGLSAGLESLHTLSCSELGARTLRRGAPIWEPAFARLHVACLKHGARRLLPLIIVFVCSVPCFGNVAGPPGNRTVLLVSLF